MKRSLLTLILACFCGCAGRMDSDLLQSRIREQEAQLSDSQREIAKTRSELKRVRLEAERLRKELAQAKSGGEVPTASSVHVAKLRIYSMASGGINKDDQPGDDAVVIQFAPLDQDNEPAKVPGNVEFTLLDPRLPESERELGKWTFTIEECRRRWTRGITSSGFQFNLPLDEPPQHSDLVVYLRFQADNERKLDVSQVVKVVVPAGNAVVGKRRERPKPNLVVDNDDDDLPPVGRQVSGRKESDSDDWANDEPDDPPKKSGHTVLHSTNWIKDDVPILR